MIYRMSIKNIDDMELNEVCASIKEVWSNDYDYEDFAVDLTTDGAYVYGELVLTNDEDYWLEGDIVYDAVEFAIDDEMTKEKAMAEKDLATLLNSYGFRKPRR